MGKPRSTEAMEREENGQISQDVIFFFKGGCKKKGLNNLGPAVLYITLRNKTCRTLHKGQQSKKESLSWGRQSREQYFTFKCASW